MKDRHRHLEDTKHRKYQGGPRNRDKRYDDRYEPRDYRHRDYDYDRVHSQSRSRSPRRYQPATCGRLSPPPDESGFGDGACKSRRSGHVKEEELADDGEKLGYQIVALMGEELGEEIDLLIAEAKIAAGISTVEGTGGLSLESEVERGEDVGLEEMGMRDTMPNRDYTNIRWRAGQPPAHEIRLKKGMRSPCLNAAKSSKKSLETFPQQRENFKISLSTSSMGS